METKFSFTFSFFSYEQIFTYVIGVRRTRILMEGGHILEQERPAFVKWVTMVERNMHIYSPFLLLSYESWMPCEGNPNRKKENKLVLELGASDRVQKQ